MVIHRSFLDYKLSEHSLKGNLLQSLYHLIQTIIALLDILLKLIIENIFLTIKLTKKCLLKPSKHTCSSDRKMSLYRNASIYLSLLLEPVAHINDAPCRIQFFRLWRAVQDTEGVPFQRHSQFFSISSLYIITLRHGTQV